MPKTPLKKYVNINGKVSKDKWQSMFRYFARYVDTTVGMVDEVTQGTEISDNPFEMPLIPFIS